MMSTVVRQHERRRGDLVSTIGKQSREASGGATGAPSSHQQLSPGKVTLTELLPPVQRKTDAGPASSSSGEAAPSREVREAAAAGVRGAGAPLPHGARIQDLFGPMHDVSGI